MFFSYYQIIEELLQLAEKVMRSFLCREPLCAEKMLTIPLRHSIDCNITFSDTVSPYRVLSVVCKQVALSFRVASSPCRSGVHETCRALCLDATNKTTRYASPLFLIVVKTPHGYLTVGVFVPQLETATCISEALEVFKQWNPDFSPEYWMVDYSHAEINALNKSFPESKVVLCDFHREQD